MKVRHSFLLAQVLYLILGSALNGQSGEPENFSGRTAIEERLEAAREELKALP